jgi:4-amino-4-deoxy-L-arabinose transferase-like glycosyltransferase
MPSWWPRDRSLNLALLVAFLLRVVPMLVYAHKPCVRDECTYLDLADSLIRGDGMVGTHGWLWAPAYPAIMAVHGLLTGYPASVQVTQLFVSLATIVMLYRLAEGEFGRGAGRVAAWIHATNPTMVFYTTSMWSECFYAALLVGAMLALRWARAGGGARGWLPGVLVGACVLFRGVATYALPIFVLALLQGRWRDRAAWRAAAACVAGAVLAVAPYSAYASAKFDAFIVSDRTLGQMLWLGDNDFPPMTFDWGNGTLADVDYERVRAEGRDHCPFKHQPAVQDACETTNGVAWIEAHPVEFVERVPLRVAQLLNPHSFLTRHLRWGRWKGLPDWFDEVLVVAVVAYSFVTLVGGTVGWFARGRDWYAVTTGLIVLYHVAAIAVLAGLSRYRVPLEPLWSVFAGALIAEPGPTLAALRADRRRLVACVVVTALLLGLMLWFLPSGWPAWRSW